MRNMFNLDNVTYQIVDGHLLLDVDLNKDTGFVTKSGNVMVATSNDWARFPELPSHNFNMVLTKKVGAVVPQGTSGPGISVQITVTEKAKAV